jgi:hypothetical protein
MPTAIEKIQAKAKALRKSYPNAKWTDLIKKASTELKKVGSIGATSKKKKATKKAATKKVVSKRKPKVIKVLKQHGTSAREYDKRHQALQAGRRISKSGRAYTETRSNRSDKGVLLGVSKPMHKDTKSHNVRISVMSGIGNLSLNQLKINTEVIERLTTKTIPSMIEELRYVPAGQKSFIKGRILEAKKYVATLKKQNTALKKHIK